MQPKTLVVIGSISAFLSVAFGAFAAHGLAARPSIDAKSLAVFHTGAQYQMYHSLALILLGAWSARQAGQGAALPAWLFIIGIVLFSGSLYALVLSGIKAFGAITPLGGLSFLAGWVAFAIIAWKA